MQGLIKQIENFIFAKKYETVFLQKGIFYNFLLTKRMRK